MGYHVQKPIWIPTKDAHLYAVMQEKNELNKYAIAVQQKTRKWLVICHQESLANSLKQYSTT